MIMSAPGNLPHDLCGDRYMAAPDKLYVCEWCDAQIDWIDLDGDVCAEFGGTICADCAVVWRS